MPATNQNVGFVDRLLRGLLAVDLVALCLSSLVNGFALLPAVLLIGLLAYSGVRGHCPLYSLLGRTSRQRTKP